MRLLVAAVAATLSFAAACGAAVGNGQAALPPFVPYHVSRHALAPAAKMAAVNAIQQQSPGSVTNVSYTQYFGYLPSSADVLVIEETSTRRSDGTITQSGTTDNVAVRRTAGHWEVMSITSAHPKPAARHLSALGEAVLANRRIQLPAAARADIASGTVSDAVLNSLTTLARSHAISVSVISSAHPVFVYGTHRRSDHPPGFAFDIGAIDGKLVIDPANRTLVTGVMREAKNTGAYQVGGPVDLDGRGTGYFTDATHRDHIHVGFPH